MKNLLTILLFASLLFTLAGKTFATPKPLSAQPENTPSEQADVSSLLSVKHRFFDDLRVKDALYLSTPAKVYVEPAAVEFSRYWLREHRHYVSKSYRKKTRERYSALVNKELAAAFDASEQFELVSKPSEAELLFLPKLDKLNIYAPDDSIHKSLVNITGSATYILQILDAKSNTLLVQFTDNRQTRDKGFSAPIRATRVSNYHDFKWLVRKWSKRTLEYLEAESHVAVAH